MMMNWKTKTLSLLVLFVLLAVTMQVANHVFIENLKAELYPADGDSISIPIFAGYITSTFVFIFTMIGVLLPSSRYWGLLGLLFLGLAAFLLLSCAAGWAMPHHYWLSVAYLVDAGYLLVLCFVALRIRKKSIEG